MPVGKYGGGSSSSGNIVQLSTAGLVHKTGDTMLGVLSMGGFRLTDVANPTTVTDGVNMGWVDMLDKDNLQLSGGTMTGDLDMGGKSILGLADPIGGKNAATKSYVDTQAAATKSYVDKNGAATKSYVDIKTLDTATKAYMDLVHRVGDTMRGELSMGGNKLTEVGTPEQATDAVTKLYVDELQDTGKKYMDERAAEWKEAMPALLAPFVEAVENKVSRELQVVLTDAATKKYVDDRLAQEVAPLHSAVVVGMKEVSGLLERTFLRLRDLYSLSVYWREPKNKTLKIVPLKTQRLTHVIESDDRGATLGVKEPGFYKVFVFGQRRGHYSEPVAISLYTGIPLVRHRQAVIHSASEFEFTAIVQFAQAMSELKLLLSYAATTETGNLEIDGMFVIERSD